MRCVISEQYVIQSQGNAVQSRGAEWREFGEAGCVRAQTGSRGLEKIGEEEQTSMR